MAHPDGKETGDTADLEILSWLPGLGGRQCEKHMKHHKTFGPSQNMQVSDMIRVEFSHSKSTFQRDSTLDAKISWNMGPQAPV